VLAFPEYLVQQGILTPAQVEAVQAQAQREVDAATEAADAAPFPAAAALFDHLYAP
jgi:TPP-dependent pyruvate/acetoin dehydrogenase alpha subunit